jgi:hypothetical protein
LCQVEVDLEAGKYGPLIRNVNSAYLSPPDGLGHRRFRFEEAPLRVVQAKVDAMRHLGYDDRARPFLEEAAAAGVQVVSAVASQRVSQNSEVWARAEDLLRAALAVPDADLQRTRMMEPYGLLEALYAGGTHAEDNAGSRGATLARMARIRRLMGDYGEAKRLLDMMPSACVILGMLENARLLRDDGKAGEAPNFYEQYLDHGADPEVEEELQRCLLHEKFHEMGLPVTASRTDIKKQWLKRSSKEHPDSKSKRIYCTTGYWCSGKSPQAELMPTPACRGWGCGEVEGVQ